MTYVIADPCGRTRDASCVEVCPVDCIHPLPGEPGFDEAEQLHIDPTECIDCEACVTACPVGAIFAEDHLPAGLERFAGLNAAYFASTAPRARGTTTDDVGGPTSDGRPEPSET